MLINFLVYFGFIKNIFKESDVEDNDFKNLSIKLQVSIEKAAERSQSKCSYFNFIKFNFRIS